MTSGNRSARFSLHKGVSAKPAGASTGARVLIKPQCQQLWCWASVAEFLHRFYGTHPPTSQPEIACRASGEDCSTGCDSGAPPVCNDPKGLRSILEQERLFEDTIDLGEIRIPVQDGRPVAFGAFRRPDEGHFAVITDWIPRRRQDQVKAPVRDYLEIMDPAGGMVRYLLFDRVKAKGYPYWGRLKWLFLTRPSSGIDLSCSRKNVLSPGRPRPDSRRWGSLNDLLKDLVKRLRSDLPGEGHEEAAQVLASFLELGAEAPESLRGLDLDDIEVNPPIFLVDIEVALKDRFVGFEIGPLTRGFTLIHRNTGRLLGLLEMKEVDKEWFLEALTFAPGPRGDRYVAEILKALEGPDLKEAAGVILRFPQLYENAVLKLDVERTERSRLFPMDAPFSFLDRFRDTKEAFLSLDSYSSFLAESAASINRGLDGSP